MKKAREEALAAQKLERERIADSAKQARQDIADSIAKVRKHIADSTAAARKEYSDSVAAVRKFHTDSLNWARQKRADSLDAIRKYKESRHYKDSVADARQRVTDSIRDERQRVLDSQRAERQRVTDSIISERTRISDSIKFVQKRRSDSLAVIREYKESKRYKDSVAFVRQQRLDSTRLARKAITDSIVAERKRINDSATAARKQVLDSLTAVRKQTADSLAAIRQARTDSLAKVKEKREKLRKSEQKLKEQKMNLAMELKIKQKREAWSNEKMLKKNWSIPRQVVQNSFTRYNYYFNANNKMNEAVANMQRVNRESYDSLISLYPFNPDKDSSLIAPDMDSIIHKVSVGIQIHDPRTKWGDDLYLLLGRAYYYKGDYENAATAFRYIIAMDQQRKNKKKGSSYARSKDEPSIVEEDEQSALDFLKHQSVHNEAILWLSRTFTQADQPENAEAVLDLIASDKKFPEHLKGKLALEKAFLYLSNGNKADAAVQLQLAANDPNVPDQDRQRAAYLSGQIFQEQGDYEASTASFQKALDLHPVIDMDFYARKNIAYNTMYSGQGQDEALSSLKRILRDNKYSNYYEQVYFILGGLSANNGNSEEAIDYLQKSISSSKSTKRQKAISFASLGNIYYNKHDYVAAKSAYDSSAILAKNAANDSTVALAIHRSNALGAVTGPVKTIRTQDSLLALAAMSEKDQRSEVRRHIRNLQQQRADSIFRAENAGINSVAQNDPMNNDVGGASWYFSNTQQMQAGLNDFKRKWGSRPLVDNWRRTSAIGFISNNSSSSSQSYDEEENAELDENGLPTEEYLLAAIPTSFERQQRAHKLIQEAYIELGDAYVMQLEDYPQATQTLDTLDVRYKEHDNKAREMYLRYVMALRQNKLPEAQKLAQQLQHEHPQSEYARQVKPTPTEDGANMDKFSKPNTTVSNYYDNAYSLLIQRQYTEVLHLVTTAQQQYKDPKYLKRFRIMEAIAHAGSGNYTLADTMLREFVKNNPSDSLRTWADAVLDYVAKNKPVQAPTVMKDSLLNGTVVSSEIKPASTVNTNTSLTGTVEISQPTGVVPKEFTYNPLDEHYCLFTFPGMEPRAMGVKAAIGDFNTFKFANANLVANIDMLSQQQGVIAVKKFANSNQAKLYMNNLRGTAQVFRDYQSSEYQLFIISAKNYQKVLSEHSIDSYLNFYRQNYK